MISELIPIFIFLGTLLVIANLVDRQSNHRARQIFYYGLVLTNFVLLVLGVGMVGTSSEMGDIAANGTFGYILIYAGGAGFILTLAPVRRFLARRSPVAADSAVHMVALLLAGFLLGQALGIQFHGGLEALAGADLSTSLSTLVANQALYLMLGLLGVGLFIRRGGAAAAGRLGVRRPSWRQIRYGLLWIPPLVILQGLIGALGAEFNPEQAELLEQASQALLADIDTVGEWFVIGIAPGVSEEILFRGALQPVFGLWATAGLFAISHTQYALSPATVAVFAVGLALGHIRNKEGTSIAILVHFGYNFVLGLLSLLASAAA